MDEWLRRLGSLPLLAQPGERWMYQVSGDVLGALIARVSGRTLGTFMRERIFEPLGMEDTGFQVPPEKLGRLPGFYRFDRERGTLEPFDDLENSAWAAEPAVRLGRRRARLHHRRLPRLQPHDADPGRHAREQVLSRAAVSLMTSDQLAPAQRAGSELFFGAHSSWGLGMAVTSGATRSSTPPAASAGPAASAPPRTPTRHPLHPAQDGLARAAEGVHRLLDPGVRGDGVAAGPTQRLLRFLSAQDLPLSGFRFIFG
jgi:CubicO group peptidase (beta-lactamase class C family)